MIAIGYLNSPLGIIKVKEENGKIILITIVDKKEEVSLLTESLKNCLEQLHEYFDGHRKVFDITYELRGTDFQKKVWKELINIPFGETKTYSGISNQIDNPKAIRAVGRAIGSNPLAIVVPCHRVIGKNGSMVGFAFGIEKKQQLLKFEGVLYAK